MRELYVYYRVAPQDEAALAGRAAALAREMSGHDPALQSRWLRRAPDARSPAAATWMEVWSRPGGIDAALAERIEAAAGRSLGLPAGARHVEAFEPLTGLPAADGR